MNPYVFFFLCISVAFICAYIAKKKSRNPLIWFIAGLFFLFGALIVVLILPPLEHKTSEDREIIANLKELQELEKTEKLENSEEKLQNNLPDKLWYYLDAQNQQYGPMTLEALMKDLKDGKIKTDTFVWNEELTDWKPLQETSDFQLFQAKKNLN